MIFVTVGNSIKGVEFHRLIREVDELAHEVDEEIVAQIGYLKEVPKNLRWVRFLGYDQAMDYFRQASLIIGHCGVGTVINGLAFRKPLILVPRSSAYGEHIDDHQVELAKRLRGTEGIFVVGEIDGLKATVLRVLDLLRKGEVKSQFSAEREKLLAFLKRYVDDYRKLIKR